MGRAVLWHETGFTATEQIAPGTFVPSFFLLIASYGVMDGIISCGEVVLVPARWMCVF